MLISVGAGAELCSGGDFGIIRLNPLQSKRKGWGIYAFFPCTIYCYQFHEKKPRLSIEIAAIDVKSWLFPKTYHTLIEIFESKHLARDRARIYPHIEKEDTHTGRKRNRMVTIFLFDRSLPLSVA
jgi:hypothetical protein